MNVNLVKINKSEESFETIDVSNVKSNLNSQLDSTVNIQKILENIKTVASTDNVYHLVLIKKLTSDLKTAFNSLYGEFSEIFITCIKTLNSIEKSESKLGKVLAKISPITGTIATIGCFAGFAMSSICPIVGWLIFGVCTAAFVVNIINAVYRSVKA